MGLLDTMDDPQFRLGMGLLAAGSARSDGAGFGQRLNEVLGGMDSWKKQKAEEKKAALQEQIYNAQLQEMTQKTARERQLLEQERAKREGFGQVFKPGLPPLMGDPTTGIMPSAGTAPSIDVARGVQLGYTLPEIEALAKVKNINLEKVARTQEVEGPNGEKLIQQLDDFGRPVGKAMPGYTPAQLVSLGDRSVFAKPQAGLSFTMGQSPDSKASNALGWANNALSRDRLNFEKNTPSFQWNADLQTFVDPKTLRTAMPAGATPSGPKLTEDQAKASGWLVQATNAFNNMKDAVAANPGANEAGFNDGVAGIPVVGNSIANMLRGEDRQKYVQGASSLSEALLRAATGAGVNMDEAQQKVRELTPQIGDSDAVIKQKEAAIPLYLKTLEMRAGPGAKQLPNIIQQKKLPGMNIDPNNLDPLGLFK